MMGSHQNRRGFSLVEVLISAIIVSLGMLGLTAIFAGAASQQVRANKFTDSVAFGNKVDALLFSRVNRLREDGPTGALSDGVWDAFVSDPEEDYISSELANAPSGRSLKIQKSVASPVDLLNPPFVFDTVTAASTTHRQDGVNKYGYFWGEISFPSIPDDDAIIRPIGKTQILPESAGVEIALTNGTSQSFRIDFQEASGGPGGGGPGGGPPGPLTPLGEWLTGGNNAELPREVFLYPDQAPPPGVTYRDPLKSGRMPDPLFESGIGYVVLNCREGYLGKVRVRWEQGVPLAASWPPTPSVLVSEVTIEPFEYLDDVLSPLRDRFLWKSDNTFEEGVRPDMMFAPLYRYREEDTDQMAVFIAGLRPLAPPDVEKDEDVLLPLDTRRDFQQERAVLRHVELELKYDVLGQFYYVRAENADEQWVIRVGQLLLMSSVDGLATAYSTGAGESADREVRIVRTTVIDGDRVGVLDDAPRLNGRSFVGPTDPKFTAFFWTLATLMETRGDDRTEWAIEPITVQIYELSR